MAIYAIEIYEKDAAQNSTAASNTRQALLIEDTPEGLNRSIVGPQGAGIARRT